MLIGPEEFPHLDPSTTYTKTSEPTINYNCIAWAVGDANRWWWPDKMMMGFWPTKAKREEKLEAFEQAFATLGYATCEDGTLEDGFEKIALYASPNPLSGHWKPKHAARQLPNGNWTSKMGPLEDISHPTVEALHDACYGMVVRYFKRPRVNP